MDHRPANKMGRTRDGGKTPLVLAQEEGPIRDNERLEHLRRLTYWLDEGFRVPGTQLRFGLDPILGLIPGVGDAAGAVLAVAILMEANGQGVPRATLVRMAANIALDTGLGAVPVLGDVFDAAWKANRRNLALLERHRSAPTPAKRADRVFVMMLGAALLGLAAAVVVGGAFLVSALLRGFG